MRKTSLLLSLLLAAPAGATEWHVYGPRALGMGGAGVAMGQGAVGAYWNPAGLGQIENPSGLQVPIGVHAELTGTVIEGANDLNHLADACDTNPGTGDCTQADIDRALAKMNQPDNGLRADVGAGAGLKIKKVVVFLNNFAYVGGVPRMDLVKTSPAQIAAEQNDSKIVLRGLLVHELGVGYGQELPFAPGLLAGANLKLMSAQAGYHDFFVLREDAGSGDSMRRFRDGAKRSVQPGIDAGLLWDMNRTWEGAPMRPRLGLTGRNLNNPKFKNPDQARLAGEPDKFALQPNVRAGLAFSPLHFWNIAADLDLTRNATPIDGVRSRQAGVGMEVNVFNRSWINIPLRAGLSRNLAQKGAKTSLTGGFGVNLLHFNVDVAGSVSPARQQIQSEGESKKIPTNVGASLQIGFMFGGAPEEKPAPKAEPKPAVKPEPTPEEAEKVRERAKQAFDDLKKEEEKKAP